MSKISLDCLFNKNWEVRMKGKGFIVEVEIRKSEFQVNFFRFDHNFELRIVSGFEGCRILILNVGNKCTFSRYPFFV